MKQLITLTILLLSLSTQATIYQIGSDKEYVSPTELYIAAVVADGDTIEIDAEDYLGAASLVNWQADNLLIRGVGGMPHMIANGAFIQGKGIWVLSGDNITVENIEFSDAAVPDENGAGIRLDGSGMTIRSCYFHDNENGILTSNPYEGDILIEYTEFANNGFGDGFTHNVYIGHVDKLTFQYNYSHHANVGHNLKSRAEENFILYNRIMDEENGNSSRLIDLPNAGFSIVMGNVLMQGDNAPNNNMFGYGLEGHSNFSSDLYLLSNTFVNKRTASCLFVDIEPDSLLSSVIANNIFAGTGTILDGPASFYAGNFSEQNIDDLFFVNEANYDYDLTSNSPVIDGGIILSPVDGYSLTPSMTYLHPTNSLDRIQYGELDIGAHEFEYPEGVASSLTSLISIYPNPSEGILYIDHKDISISEIRIFDALGTQLWSGKSSNVIQLDFLSNGNYLMQIITDSNQFFVHKFSILH